MTIPLSRGLLVSTLVCWGCCMQAVHGQFAKGTAAYNELTAAHLETFKQALRENPATVEFTDPSLALLRTDDYRYQPLIGDKAPYRANVIISPCLGHDYNCCHDRYGTPEYSVRNMNPSSPKYGTTTQVLSDGTPLAQAASRLPDNAVSIEESCTGIMSPDPQCAGFRELTTPYPVYPVCWDRNDTLDATASCRSPLDGTELKFCMEVGFTQNAYIVECGGDWKDSDHCGTFLEIHIPDDNTILAQTKLRGQFPSGYRQTIISTNYQGDPQRVLCNRPYEIWWVQRTRSDFIIETKKPFQVTRPSCDWDEVNDRPFSYATVT